MPFPFLAAPVLAAIAAKITAGQAIGIAIATGATGYAVSKCGEKKRTEAARREGAKAGEAVAKEQYEERFRALCQRLEQYRKQEWAVAAMFGLGAAAASPSVRAGANLKNELAMLICGLSFRQLSPELQAWLGAKLNTPLCLDEARREAEAYGVARDDQEAIIALVWEINNSLFLYPRAA